MDKRTLFFIISLSLTLFVVNIFFEKQNSHQRQEWLAQQNGKQSLEKQEKQEALIQRTASLESLPIAYLYFNTDKNEFLTSGVWFQDQVLTLSWVDDLPETVYVQAPNSNDLKKYTLAFSQKEIGAPVLYRLNPKQEAVIPTLPSFGSYDLQLVTFYPYNSQYSTEVTLGEYEDGNFTVSSDVLKDYKVNDKEDLYTAIALFKTDQGYTPVGFYEAENHRLIPLQEAKGFENIVKIQKPESSKSAHKEKEQFFVLENAYQQLVFSNHGGALAEINLPFKTKENELSVVREIEFDRIMVENHPYNARFPVHGYYTPSQSQDSFKWEWHSQGQLGGYYPLLRRDLIESGKSNRKSIELKPQYYALNFVSEYPELSELVYEVKEFSSHSITFESNQNHRRITKRFFLDEEDKAAPYCLNLEIKIEGATKGLWMTSGIPEVEWISGATAPVLKYRITRNQKPEVEKIELPKDVLTISSVYPDWICNSNGFLGTILDPITEIEPGFRVKYVAGQTAPSRLTEIDQEYDRFQASAMPGYMTMLPLKSKGGLMKFRLFAGPFDETILKQADAIYSNPETGYNPDYIACQTMHGWFTFISEPFAKFLLVLMKFFHYVTGSWALSIILLTICLRIILYPLNAWSTRSMVRMQQISPEVVAVQEKYKKDPKKAQLEVMALYREKGINPASGCLPLLIQMPFLIGMFDLLKSSFSLRGAPFIPGWIDDLTAPDVLFSWHYPIFFIGTEFHLLPILLGLVMFAQQKFFSTGPKDPKLMTDQQRQQKAMGSMMSVVFAVMFYHFPSGLNLYWLSSMLLGMLQQWYIGKKLQRTHEAIIPLTGHPNIASRKKTGRKS